MWRKVADVADPGAEIDTWFRIFSQDEQALPKDLSEWKKSDFYKVIGLKWSKNLATQQLQDFSALILEWTKKSVRDRHTFGESRSESDRLAPRTFDSDRDGVLLPWAKQLREIKGESARERQITEWIDDRRDKRQRTRQDQAR